jgi:hypothetical protein
MMVLPSNNLDQLSHTIQVLQQLQRLLTISATLADVADLLACVEAEFGAECSLEQVIQRLVGEHLAAQLAQRAPVQPVCLATAA